MKRAMRRRKTWQRQAAAITAAMMAMSVGGIAYAMPQGEVIRSGKGEITRQDKDMTVNQDSKRLAIDWSGFDIANDERVTFRQPDKDSVALNRVVGDAASVIDGTLSGNGHVYVINPNGVLFGKNASVDVGSLVASTARISDSDMTNFANADGITMAIPEDSSAKVINAGTIRAEGGLVVLHAAEVENSGTITNPEGTTALAAARNLSLSADTAGKINFTVDGALAKAKALNSGMLKADGGYLVMTARSAGDVMSTVVNNTGTMEAKTLRQNEKGEILLDGGDNGIVELNGTLDVSGMEAGQSAGSIKAIGAETHVEDGATLHAIGAVDGGLIETSGDYLEIGDNVDIDAAGKTGKAGEWLLDPLDVVISASRPDNATAGNATDNTDGRSYSLGNVTNESRTSWVNSKTVSQLLSKGTNVRVESADINKAASISVNSTIEKTGTKEASFTLEAQRNITINKDITAKDGKLNVTLNSDTDGDAIGAVIINANIKTNGGNTEGAVSDYYTGKGTFTSAGWAKTATRTGGNKAPASEPANKAIYNIKADSESYNLTAKGAASGYADATTKDGGTVEILRRQINVNGSGSQTYGNATINDWKLTASLTGKQEGATGEALVKENNDTLDNRTDILSIKSGSSYAEHQAGRTTADANPKYEDAVNMENVGFENGAGVNYEIVKAQGDLKVNKAALTINTEDKTTTYGTVDKDFKSDIKGLTNGDDKSIVNLTYATKGYLSDTKTNDVGDYDINTSVNELKNYDVKTNTANLHIKQADLTIQIGNASTVYGTKFDESQYGYKYKSGITNGDTKATLDAALGGMNYTNDAALDGTNGKWTKGVGDYDLKGKGVNNLTNYKVTYLNGTATVTPYTITEEEIVNPDGSPLYTTKYGQKDAFGTATFTGVNGDGTYELAITDSSALATAGAGKVTQDVGKNIYDTTVELSEAMNGNYQFADGATSKTFEKTASVTPAELTIKTKDVETEYGTVKTTTSEVEGLVNGDLPTGFIYDYGDYGGAYLDSNTKTNDVNTYHFGTTLSGAEFLKNYTITGGEADVKIDPKDVTFFVSGTGNTLDDITYTVTPDIDAQLAYGEHVDADYTPGNDLGSNQYGVVAHINGTPIVTGDVAGNYRYNYGGLITLSPTVPTKPDIDPHNPSNLDGSGSWTSNMGKHGVPGVERVAGLASAELPFFKVEAGQVSHYGTYDVAADPDKVRLEPTGKRLPEPNQPKTQYREYTKALTTTDGTGMFRMVYDGSTFNITPVDDGVLALMRMGDVKNNVELSAEALHAGFSEMGILLEDLDGVYVHFDTMA